MTIRGIYIKLVKARLSTQSPFNRSIPPIHGQVVEEEFIYTTYIFWLTTVSLLCLVLERIVPWRKQQKLLRPEFFQDTFWLSFNGYLASILFAGVFAFIYRNLDSLFSFAAQIRPQSFRTVSDFPLIAQILIFLFVTDFIEWCIHNALHRVAWLWKIHRLHHSIKIMDWIGNFRFHWIELFVYQTVKYLPVTMLGVQWYTVLICSVISTTIGFLNHSNLAISWGPLRYILNSPRMHIWHHEKVLRSKAGINFGIVFSIWDWIFQTAYMPRQQLQPAEIGYIGEEKIARNVVSRFFLPFIP